MYGTLLIGVIKKNFFLNLNMINSAGYIGSITILKKEYIKWITHVLQNEEPYRETRWTESVAVGTKSFLETVKQKLGIRGMKRKIESDTYGNVLEEPRVKYETENPVIKNCNITGNNSFRWDINYK